MLQMTIFSCESRNYVHRLYFLLVQNGKIASLFRRAEKAVQEAYAGQARWRSCTVCKGKA